MTQTITTTSADVPLPVGAVGTEEWQAIGDGRFYRNFEGEKP